MARSGGVLGVYESRTGAMDRALTSPPFVALAIRLPSRGGQTGGSLMKGRSRHLEIRLQSVHNSCVFYGSIRSLGLS